MKKQIDTKTETEMKYDERRKELTRTISTINDKERTKFEVILNEKGIRDVVRLLLDEKAKGEKALQKADENLSSLNKQMEDVKKIDLTDEQKELKKNLKILQKDNERENLLTKIKETEENIKYIKNEIKDRNVKLSEIKGKVRNLNLHNDK